MPSIIAKEEVLTSTKSKTVIVILIAIALLLVLRGKASGKEVDPKRVDNIHQHIERRIEELPPFPKGNPTPQEQPKKVVQSVYKPQMTESEALEWIISREGGATSVNKSSLACGLAQSLPCSKILTYAGVDLSKYNLNTYAGVKAAISTVPAEVQRAWMVKYCIRRYGSVVGAVAFWRSHGWY